MRESQKMSLDYKLHTKIIDSIIAIQRWFKAKSQREKFLSFRTAAIKIQSFWRMRLAQTKYNQLKMRANAAIVIQSTYKMYRDRKMYKKLLNGLIIMQAQIRGRAARVRFKRYHRQKMMKERYKLRPTQSLPLNDRVVDGGADTIDVEISRSYPKLVQSVQNSFDLLSDNANAMARDATKQMASLPASQPSHHEQDASLLNKAEQQFKSLMVTAKASSLSEQIAISDTKRFGLDSHAKNNIEGEESVDSRNSRSYNVDTATKQYFDDSFMIKK